MEWDDLRVALGLSSYKSENLTCNGIVWEIWNQWKEWNFFTKNAIGTVSAYLIRISEFRVISKYHGSTRGEIRSM